MTTLPFSLRSRSIIASALHSYARVMSASLPAVAAASSDVAVAAAVAVAAGFAFHIYHSSTSPISFTRSLSFLKAEVRFFVTTKSL